MAEIFGLMLSASDVDKSVAMPPTAPPSLPPSFYVGSAEEEEDEKISVAEVDLSDAPPSLAVADPHLHNAKQGSLGR